MRFPVIFRSRIKFPVFRHLLIVSTAILFLSFLPGQPPYDYDKDLLAPDFHHDRREALRNLMPDSSVAVFFANPVRNRANDVSYDYHPDPNFFYLSGLREPNAMLVIFKEKQQIDTAFTNEILFVQDRNPKEESWTGRRLGADGAKRKLEIATVWNTKTIPEISVKWGKYRKVFFFPINEQTADNPDDAADLSDMVRRFKTQTERYANTDTELLKTYMAMLRQIKMPAEMVLLRKAIDISSDAHIELMKALEQDMTEYHAQAILEYEFRMQGAEAVGYPSICGAGENSCILHYVTNRKPLEMNNLMVVDAGAEYHGYTADITRTLPADGTFSAEQKIIYDIVLEAQEAAIKACISGNEFRAPHKIAQKIIKKRLLELGIIKKEEDYILYFFHGTSHYLGLDVHDAGLYGKLEPGNVITVEPGIYIPEGSPCDPKWWNIGVRIEDDILITNDQPDVLSGKIPKTTAAIEKLMLEKSYLNGK